MKSYDSSNIKVFKGLDAVRKRPGMYIGNTDDGSGLHKMIFEVVDNSVDEHLIGECNLIKVFLHKNGYVTIVDNGRGMPVDAHEEGVSAAEVIMTVLHSGAKFDEESYYVSSGLHGVGVSVVNALSSDLILRIYRDGFIYEQQYCFGKPLYNLNIVGKSENRGTEISFLPDDKIFKFIDFDYKVLFDRFNELAFLNSGIQIILADERVNPIKTHTFLSTGGLKAFLEYINASEKIVHKDIILFSEVKNGIRVNLGAQWIDSSKEVIACYTNNILQRDGGSHLIALKSALTKVFKPYVEEFFLKKSDLVVSGDDIRDGLVSILSIYMPDPKFSSQIKDKLVSFEAKQAVEYIVYNKFKNFIYENPAIVRLISVRIISSVKARYAAKKAKELSKKKDSVDFISLYGKLSDCQERNPVLSELFLVEGDSAGGSAKQARDRRTQAILPLKGKILNVERSGFNRILSSVELRSVVSALKCGVGADGYDEKKLRYHKIIFMTDADVDGAHIKTLLLTFFYRQIPMLIINGHIFIANPPLYKLSNKDEFFYFNTKDDFNEFLFSKIFSLCKTSFFSDIIFFDKVIFGYKKLNCVLDSLSKVGPRFFFEKFVYFDDVIIDVKHRDFLDKIRAYEIFLNKSCSSNQSIIIGLEKLPHGYLTLLIKKYGVLKEFNVDLNFFSSEDYLKLLEFRSLLKQYFININVVKFNNTEYGFYDFSNLMSLLSDKVLCRYNIQRYKGLGEMNPDQLWDTTMNPETRVLKVVKIKDVVGADNIFANLMGDNIIARKNFIDKHVNFFLDLDF